MKYHFKIYETLKGQIKFEQAFESLNVPLLATKHDKVLHKSFNI